MKRTLLLLAIALGLGSSAHAAVSIKWSDINKDGSSLAHLATRNFADLQNQTSGFQTMFDTITIDNNPVASTDYMIFRSSAGGLRRVRLDSLITSLNTTTVVGNKTWGDGSTNSFSWTFDRATGADPVIAIQDDGFSFSANIEATQASFFILRLQDVIDSSHYLSVLPGSNLTADRTLTITTGDADRTLTLTGNASVSGTNTGDQTSIASFSGTQTSPALVWDMTLATAFRLPLSTTFTLSTAGDTGIDTDGDGSNLTQELIRYTGGSNAMWIPGVDALPTTNGMALFYNGTTKKFEFQSLPGGGDVLASNLGSEYTAGAATFRANVGLTIGTHVQAFNANLSTWAGITPGSGVGTFLATPSGANLASALTTALPATKGGTGLTALGTGVATALGNNLNSSGGLVAYSGDVGDATGTSLDVSGVVNGLSFQPDFANLGAGTELAVGYNYYVALSGNRTLTFTGSAVEGKTIVLAATVSATSVLTVPPSVAIGDTAATTSVTLGPGLHRIVWQYVNSVWERAETTGGRNVVDSSDPAVTNDVDEGYVPGNLWFNTATGHLWWMESNADGAAVWNNAAKERITTVSGTTSLSAGQCYNGTVYVSVATTVTLPAIADGMCVRVYSTGANVVTIDVQAADRIRLDGTALSDGNTIDSSGAAGDFIELRYDSSDGWSTWARSGTWADGGAS